ncbi:tetratricopeptide repeat protein [Actomonas aquatica]|uniref:Tetratricopeptide repeat protein n=1 Tax=Actomonas aquatica TaxID=2866162 RepID=A0ABZ1C5F8_9BACT|nr:tetratricopeptide repeat protein [Opitutus sp. WL0086]WRQ86583.1 tetratricopeptide repeat protein [Opitutus sp. WL0086]
MAQLGTQALQEEAQVQIERGAWGEAVPFLRELNRRLRESSDAAAVRSREQVLYFLGLGQLQMANLPGAADTLAEFIATYPESPQAVTAQLYRGDTYYYQGRLADARALYEELGRRWSPGDLGVAERALYWEHYADCVYAEKDWEAGAEVFAALQGAAAQLLDAGAAREKGAKAASYRLQAAIAANDFAAALELLPELTGGAGRTRHDLALNLALMRGGDELYQAGRHGEALFFYELVLRPAELRRFWTEQRARLEAEQARVVGVAWLADRALEVEGELREAAQRLGQLGEAFDGETSDAAKPVSDYTQALDFRVARCYLAEERVFEAYWAFVRLEESATADGFVEEAVYGQVKTAAAAGFDDRVRRTARRYLREAAYERFIGDVGYELLQTALRAEDELAVQELTEAFMARVRLDPRLQEAPKLIYLVGSTLLERGDLAGLRERLEPMLAAYPEYGFSDGLAYWLGMADVLEGRYRPARAYFERIVADFPNGGYAEDAHFRIGVCWFGLLDYKKARLKLDGFLQDYPDSRLVCEAQALLGDLAAAEGRVDAALNAYAAARDAGGMLSPPNQGYIDHAVFQGGKLLAGSGRWAEMAEWFESYLRRWGEDGRAGDAIYELGRAQVALGRTDAMLDLWIESILRFGDDPRDTGPDLMLAEYPEHYRAVRGGSPEGVFKDALRIATAQAETTLVLRLATALRALPEVAGDGLLEVTAENLEQASGAVLVAAARRLAEADPALARTALERAVELSPFAPFAPEAWARLAELREQAGEVLPAIAAWQHVAATFPTAPEARVARLREGDLQRERGATANAIAAYREVLKVREWRGAAWAEANFKIGLTHFEAGDYEKAFGFCQRVYVLYGGVAEWAAEAYLTSGLALERLGRGDEAVATYRELVQQNRLADTKAAAAARERLEALGAS